MPKNQGQPGPPASDSLPFTLDPVDRFVADTVPTMPTPARWAAFNAIRHLKRAWLLQNVDQPMAVLRCITAEEEAATALFRALQRRKYLGAERLDAHNHLHKNAVIPFFEAITRTVFAVALVLPEVQFIVDAKSRRPRLALREKLVDAKTGEQFWAYPQPPLNFLLESGGIGRREQKENFSAGILQIVTEAKANSVRDYLRQRANDRNKILYATKGGYFEVKLHPEKGFEIYRDRVFGILKAYMLVDQYRSHQLFVQQALDAFLLVIDSKTLTVCFD